MSVKFGVRLSPRKIGNIFCEAYPHGFPFVSKTQGFLFLEAFARAGKITTQEYTLMKMEIESLPIELSEYHHDMRLQVILQNPKALDEMAPLAIEMNEEEAALNSIEQVVGNFANPDNMKAALEALKQASLQEPSFVLYTTKRGTETFGVLTGSLSQERLVYNRQGALRVLKDMVIKEMVDPDKFGKIKRAILASDLPKEGNDGQRKRDAFTLFMGNEGGALIRILNPEYNNNTILAYTKIEALELLKCGIKKEIFPFELFADVKKMIDTSPLPEKGEQTVIPLPHGFNGILLMAGNRFLRSELAIGIEHTKTSEGLRFQSMSLEKVREVFITPPPTA